MTRLENALYSLSSRESGRGLFQSDSYFICHRFFVVCLFLAIHPASLWDPHFRFVVNVVLFLHRPLGCWSQTSLFVCLNTRARVREDRQLPERGLSRACPSASRCTWHLDWRSYVEDWIKMVFVQEGTPVRVWGASSNGVRKERSQLFSPLVYGRTYHCTEYCFFFNIGSGLCQYIATTADSSDRS